MRSITRYIPTETHIWVRAIAAGVLLGLFIGIWGKQVFEKHKDILMIPLCSDCLVYRPLPNDNYEIFVPGIPGP